MRDIPRHGVKAGDLGGHVANGDILSQKGDAWIGEDAIAYCNTRVSGNALVSGHAVLIDNAKVKSNAKVLGYSTIAGKACVDGNAIVDGDSKLPSFISGNARITGNAKVFSAKVWDNAIVKDNAVVEQQWADIVDKEKEYCPVPFRQTAVYGHAIIEGNAKIQSASRVSGGMVVSGNAVVSGESILNSSGIIKDNVKIQEKAKICGPGKVFISGKTIIRGNVLIDISGTLSVSGTCEFWHNARIRNNLREAMMIVDSLICDNARVEGKCGVFRCAVDGDAIIDGEANISDFHISGNTIVEGGNIIGYQHPANQSLIPAIVIDSGRIMDSTDVKLYSGAIKTLIPANWEIFNRKIGDDFVKTEIQAAIALVNDDTVPYGVKSGARWCLAVWIGNQVIPFRASVPAENNDDTAANLLILKLFNAGNYKAAEYPTFGDTLFDDLHRWLSLVMTFIKLDLETFRSHPVGMALPTTASLAEKRRIEDIKVNRIKPQ